jgi:hypothetical protein
VEFTGVATAAYEVEKQANDLGVSAFQAFARHSPNFTGAFDPGMGYASPSGLIYGA